MLQYYDIPTVGFRGVVTGAAVLEIKHILIVGILMKKIAILSLFAVMALTLPLTYAQKAKVKNVAVIEIEVRSDASKDIRKEEAMSITGTVRREAVKHLPKDRYNVMTTETVQSMGDAVLAECFGENCVITLGSKIGADYKVRFLLSRLKTTCV
jgi:hypothetical protein